MNNIAGHEASIFLFKFIINGNGISCILNDSIAEDMRQNAKEQFQSLSTACMQTLQRYKELSRGDVIFDCYILTDGHVEVMLSKGLGNHFIEEEKQNLFDDAAKMAVILQDVMAQASKEMEEGTYTGPEQYTPQYNSTGKIQNDIQKLGEAQDQSEDTAYHIRKYQYLVTLLNEHLSPDLKVSRSYDHRGYSLAFEHEKLDYIGKIVIVEDGFGEVNLAGELSNESPDLTQKKTEVFKLILEVIKSAIRESILGTCRCPHL